MAQPPAMSEHLLLRLFHEAYVTVINLIVSPR